MAGNVLHHRSGYVAPDYKAQKDSNQPASANSKRLDGINERHFAEPTPSVLGQHASVAQALVLLLSNMRRLSKPVAPVVSHIMNLMHALGTVNTTKLINSESLARGVRGAVISLRFPLMVPKPGPPSW